jgi:membrane protein implicated in regulation of membrane protease activity
MRRYSVIGILLTILGVFTLLGATVVLLAPSGGGLVTGVAGGGTVLTVGFLLPGLLFLFVGLALMAHRRRTVGNFVRAGECPGCRGTGRTRRRKVVGHRMKTVKRFNATNRSLPAGRYTEEVEVPIYQWEPMRCPECRGTGKLAADPSRDDSPS